MKKAICFSMVLLILGEISVFAVAQGEAAAPDERPTVTIVRNYRGWDPARIDWDHVQQNDQIFRHIEEKFNVKLEMPFNDGDNDVVIAGMASGDIGDIVDADVGQSMMPMPLWRSWLRDGLVHELKDDFVDQAPDRWPVLDMMFKDPVYTLFNEQKNGDPEDYYLVHSGRTIKTVYGSLAFNGYLLEELGLDVPETYDELINAMKRAKRELNISGYGWPAYQGTRFFYMERHFFHTHGLQMEGFWTDENGTWYDATIDSRNKARWEEIQGFAEEGLIYPRWLTGGLWDHMDDIVAGRHLAGAFKGPNPDQYLYFWNTFKKAHPDAVMEKHFPQGMHLLKGPGGQGRNYGTPLQVLEGNFIPTASEHPDRALDILHYTQTAEFQDMRWWGVKGVHYTKDDKSDFDLRTMFETMKGWFYGGKSFEEMSPLRIMWEPFQNTTDANTGIVPYEKYGDFYNAQSNSIDMRTIRSMDFWETQGNALEVWQNFGDSMKN